MTQEPDVEIAITVNVRVYTAIKHSHVHVGLEVPHGEQQFSAIVSPAEWYGISLAMSALGEKLARIGAGLDTQGRPITDDEARQHTAPHTDA